MFGKKQLLLVGIVLLFAGTAALLLAGSASASWSGPPYSGSGDWSVDAATGATDEIIDVSGYIYVYDSLSLDNTTIRFTGPDLGIYVYAPDGQLTWGPGAGSTMITVSDDTYYWTFTIEDVDGNVDVQNVTLDHIKDGVNIYGGDAASVYFAYVTETHALNYGFRLWDSSATLLHVTVTLDIASQIQTDGWVEIYNYTYDYGWGYIQYDIGQERIQYLTAVAVGVETIGGSPWIDGVEVHVPEVAQRLDIELGGGYRSDYYYDTPCGASEDSIYTYNDNDYFYGSVDISGLRGVGSLFAYFDGVTPPPENFTLDIHYDIVGMYSSNTYYCYGGSSLWSSNDESVWFNYMYLTPIQVVGVYLEDVGLSNFDNLQYAMGRVSVTVISDWVPSQQYYSDYFRLYQSSIDFPQVYALWSIETVTTFAAAAVTTTDFSLTNSYFSGAGVRIDRNFNYYASGAGANTIFVGAILVNNITVVGAGGTGVSIAVKGYAPFTFDQFLYVALVSNSAISAVQPLSLSLPNAMYERSAYNSSINIVGNRFSGGSLLPASNFLGLISIDTGGHSNSYSSDLYAAEVAVTNNIFSDLRGPVIGWDYSQYEFAGGGKLNVSQNIFTNVSYYYTAAVGGGNTPGQVTDAFIKTTAENVLLENNYFNDFAFVYGILGGKQAADPNNPYYEFVICSMYIQYGDYYSTYGCSWPLKTPTIEVTGNTFEKVRMSGTGTHSFVIGAGHAHILFDSNQVDNSTATFVNAYLYYGSFVGYKFAVEDLDVKVMNNVVTNQTTNPFSRYEDPYKTGQPFVMMGNTYADSRVPFFTWSGGWWASMSSSYAPNDYGAKLTVTYNTFSNLSLGNEGSVRLTGSMTIENNSWDGISGWAVIAERMKKIPSIAGNTISQSSNGYWFSPAVISGLKSTATFADQQILVTNTAIRIESANLVLYHMDFGPATTAVDIRNGFAEIYSSRIVVLSGKVTGGATIDVYNDIGYAVRWANAAGVDSGAAVANALVVTSTANFAILTSSRTDSAGLIPTKTIEVWRMSGFGAVQVNELYLPLHVVSVAGGISFAFDLPQLAPGETLSFFDDYPQYPVLLVDTIVPTISIAAPQAGSAVGSQTIAVQGFTLEHGSGVLSQRIRLDNGPWVDLPAQGGVWSVSLEGVSEGSHTLYGEVSDIATNFYSTQVDFSVDVTPPTLTLLRPLEESTRTNEPLFAIQGHVEPADSGVALNGIRLVPTGRGDFFYPYTLSEGLNVLRFVATDAGGNQAVLVRTITYDHFAPFLQVDAPINGLLTNLQTIDVFGKTDRDARVTVAKCATCVGEPAFVNPLDGTFALQQVILDDLYEQTENVLHIKAVDLAGNTAWVNRTVILDTRAPSIELGLEAAVRDKIQAGLPVAVTSLNVKGVTDSSDARIRIADQEVPLNGFAFSRVMVLREGLNVIIITSDDLAGNHAQLELRVTRDTVRPVMTLVTPTEASVLTNQSTLEITGYTDTEVQFVKILYVDARGEPQTGLVLVVPVGQPAKFWFEYQLPLNTDGNEHVVQVLGIDQAENFGEASFTYTAKVNKPFLEILGFKQRVTETFVWINGTTEPGIDTVTINGQQFPVEDQGFNVRWNLPIAEGNYSFTVSVRDAAGNVETWNDRTEVHAAAPPPPPPVQQAFWERFDFQLAAGVGLLAVAAMALLMAFSRRREVD